MMYGLPLPESTAPGEGVEKRELSYTVVGLVQTLWKTVWRFLKKLKIEFPFDPAIPLLGIYLEKTLIRKDTCTPMFTAALFTIARTWKQPLCPSTDEQIKKLGGCMCVCVYIYTHSHTYIHIQIHTQWNITQP